MSYRSKQRAGGAFSGLAKRLRLEPKRLKRYSLVAAIVLAAVLLVFAEVIRPNQDAKSYTARLEAASKPLQACFEKLSATTELGIYSAPDIPLKDKQKDATTITNQINACRDQVDAFNAQAHRLLSLHFAGYTQTYHQAKVNQRQAYDVIGQSQDVLNQYSELAAFLSEYYGHIDAFLSYFQNIQQIENNGGFPSAASVKVLSQQAADLHKRATAVRGLKANPGFEQVKTATADMFDAIAVGFDNAVVGYSNFSDYYTNVGIKQIDAAVATYDSTVINLPFDQLQVSYVPKQVQQLPVKVENLLAAQSE